MDHTMGGIGARRGIACHRRHRRDVSSLRITAEGPIAHRSHGSNRRRVLADYVIPQAKPAGLHGSGPVGLTLFALDLIRIKLAFSFGNGLQLTNPLVLGAGILLFLGFAWCESRREQGQRWERADELDEGDVLLSQTGSVARVNGFRLDAHQVAPAYNLTVEGLHTYYVLVGNTPVLVHNDCGTRSVGELANLGLSLRRWSIVAGR